MTDNYLDSFLSELEKANDGSKYYDALKRSTQLESDHFGRAVDLLKGKGYIKVYANEAMPATVTITSVGSKFLNDGGFKHETELKNSPLNAIKLSYGQ